MTERATQSRFWTIVRTEWLLAMRNKQDLFNGIMFFLLVIMLFPLGIDPGVDFLSKVAGGLIWVAFTLALMLTVGQMFKQDFEDGSIEQWCVSSYPMPMYVLAKVFAQWVVVVVPLILVSPVLALMLHMPMAQMPVLLATLLLGTPSLALIIATGSALTAGVRGGGILLMLLILPIVTPLLIFSTGILQASLDQLPTGGLFALLGVFFILSLMLTPFATSAALKITIDQ